LPRITYPEELFVGGLALDANEDDVRQMLEKNGQILQFIWKESTKNKDGKLMAPIVFVKYSTKEATDKALALHGTDFNGLKLKVQLSDNSHHFAVTKAIFVGGVPADVTEQEVRQLFSTIGNIVSVRLFETTKNQSKAAVVNFKNQEAADKAFRLPNPKIRDCLLRLSYNSQGRSSIFIGEAPAAITVEEIRKIFSNCGEIKDIRIIDAKDKNGLKNVFVDFVYEDSAKKAIEITNNKILDTPVKITLALPPKDPKLRAKQL